VNEFVNECRREWKRLGVPRSTADEMAAELAVDLDEGTPEEVLGTDAANARVFARSWAEERGVIRERRRSRIPAVLAALALIPTVLGAVLVLTSDDDSKAAVPAAPSGNTFVWVPPSQYKQAVIVAEAQAAHDHAVLLEERSRLSAAPDDDSSTLGIVLLIAGLALLVPSTLFWSGRAALNR
jgi:hypothetical protein